MSYYAGFVAAVPTDRKAEFVAHARAAWEQIFKPLGALAQVETWGDDVPDGKVTSFPMAVKCGPGETVVFSWIEWPDRATYDAANERMAAPDFAPDVPKLPFDGQRMILGGFDGIVHERA